MSEQRVTVKGLKAQGRGQRVEVSGQMTERFDFERRTGCYPMLGDDAPASMGLQVSACEGTAKEDKKEYKKLKGNSV